MSTETVAPAPGNPDSRVSALCEWSRGTINGIKEYIEVIRARILDIEYADSSPPTKNSKYTLFVYPSVPGQQRSRGSKKLESLPSHFPESLLFQVNIRILYL